MPALEGINLDSHFHGYKLSKMEWQCYLGLTHSAGDCTKTRHKYSKTAQVRDNHYKERKNVTSEEILISRLMENC